MIFYFHFSINNDDGQVESCGQVEWIWTVGVKIFTLLQKPNHLAQKWISLCLLKSHFHTKKRVFLFFCAQLFTSRAGQVLLRFTFSFRWHLQILAKWAISANGAWLFRTFWTLLNSFELFWTFMNFFELFWTPLDFFLIFLNFFELFWNFWTFLNSFELF